MSRDFTIYLNPSFASLGGNWICDTPPINPCTATEAANSLNADGSIETKGTGLPGIWTASFFTGDIILSGGNPEDGTYESVNDLPVGATPNFAIVITYLKDPVHGSEIINATISTTTAGVSDPILVNALAQFLSKVYETNPSFFQLSTDQIILTIDDESGTSYTRVLGQNYGAVGIIIIGSYDIVEPEPGQDWYYNPETEEYLFGYDPCI